jgi:Flp pilus assembly protein TadG
MRRRRDERAASTLEMAFVAPVFLLLIFGIVEFGLWMYARNVVTLSAREGASYLRVSGALDDPSGWEGAAEDSALVYADQVGLMTDVSATASSDDEQATVEVCGHYAHPMGILADSAVCQTVTVEIEQFEPDTGELQ